MKRVLVIEDDVDLLMALQDNFEVEGYDVITATDGEDGLAKAIRTAPDAILLDVMLPQLSGFDVCRSLVERGVTVPILILTARSNDTDKVLGLELGAHDYVTKPFNIHELMARVRAMIRRSSSGRSAGESLTVGDVRIDLRHQFVQQGRRTASLSSLECEVLRYLVARRGEVVSRDQLLTNVWGYHVSCTTRSVDNLISRLRQKIERDPHKPLHLLTVHGTGYRFVP